MSYADNEDFYKEFVQELRSQSQSMYKNLKVLDHRHLKPPLTPDPLCCTFVSDFKTNLRLTRIDPRSRFYTTLSAFIDK